MINKENIEKARQSQYRNGNIIPVYFMDEQWEIISQTILPTVRNCYMISNYGRIYDINNNCLLKYRLTLSGICMVRLNKIEKSSDMNVAVARLMMKVFNPIDNQENMQIWYKDNNPLNLNINNLFWTSRSDNHNKRRNYIDHNISLDQLHQAQYRPTSNIIIPAYFENEQWIDITNYAVPNIQPWYMVSTYGRVFSKLTGYLLQTDILNSGYIRIQFRSIDNTKLDCLVHRIMMLCYCPILNKDKMQVNHKDGIRINNYIWNLEWVTQSDNMIHSTNSNLNIRYGNSKLQEDVIHAICKGIELGMTPEEISITILEEPYDIRLDDIIRRIKNKKNWENISCKYNF